MKTDTKIKKALQSELQPQKSFSEFCEQTGIAAEAAPLPAPAKKIAWWKRVAIPLAAVAAVLVVVLPITLTRGRDTDGSMSAQGNVYNVGNEVTKVVDFSVLKSDPDLVLYNTDYEKSKNYSAYLCSEGDDVLLAYVVKSVVYGGQVDGTLYAYTFDFLARCYAGYAPDYTLVYEWYEQNGMAYDCGGVTYHYGIVSGQDGTSAIICYKNGKYDYFVRMRLVVGGVTLKESDVRSFISLAFGKEEV